MSEQPTVSDHEDIVALANNPGWLSVASTRGIDQAERYGRLLERAEIPFLLDDAMQDVAKDDESSVIVTVHVPESCYDRACEVIARDHAETSDGRDDEDELLDDEDEEEPDDLVDAEDDVPVPDDDDKFEDDNDDHPESDSDDT